MQAPHPAFLTPPLRWNGDGRVPTPPGPAHACDLTCSGPSASPASPSASHAAFPFQVESVLHCSPKLGVAPGYPQARGRFQNRVSLVGNTAHNDGSIVLQGVRESDGGSYTCHLHLGSLTLRRTVVLTVDQNEARGTSLLGGLAGAGGGPRTEGGVTLGRCQTPSVTALSVRACWWVFGAHQASLPPAHVKEQELRGGLELTFKVISIEFPERGCRLCSRRDKGSELVRGGRERGGTGRDRDPE